MSATVRETSSLSSALRISVDRPLCRTIHGVPPGCEGRRATTSALRVDRSRHAGQQVEYVGKAIAESPDVGAVTRKVVEHALGTTKCLSGSWKVHRFIVQLPLGTAPGRRVPCRLCR